jgi:hypothetical protein
LQDRPAVARVLVPPAHELPQDHSRFDKVRRKYTANMAETARGPDRPSLGGCRDLVKDSKSATVQHQAPPRGRGTRSSLSRTGNAPRGKTGPGLLTYS